MKPKKRRLAAIMFTDIVGYSAIMQQSEEMANRLRMRHREVFNRVTAQYGGEILQYFGDGTLSIFPSATAATECGVALQQALKKEPKVPLRIGIHTGEITYSEEEIYGDGVNIAARLESLCIPGGIFISGKVYDDIKNHSRLRAKSLGHYQLKNIQREVEVYAISNAGVSVPEFELQAPQAMGASAPAAATAPSTNSAAPPVGKKRKGVAFLLAFFLGIFGAHRFYLDQRGRGIAHLVIFFLAAIANILPDEAVAILAIIGFIDAMIFLAMPRADFDARHNSGAQASQQTRQAQRQQAPAADTKQILRGQFSQHLSKAVSLHRNYDYEGAMEYLHKALDIKYDAPEVHFLLACCYSSSEDAEKSLHHLDLAVAFGLKNADDRIKNHGDLSYLRVQPSFDAFAENGYRLPKEERPQPRPSLLEDEETGLILPAPEDEEIEGLDVEKEPLRRDEERGEG
jgi:class 3 adenylate cyclase/TM2 domain-containing membrane protein YozV